MHEIDREGRCHRPHGPRAARNHADAEQDAEIARQTLFDRRRDAERAADARIAHEADAGALDSEAFRPATLVLPPRLYSHDASANTTFPGGAVPRNPAGVP